MPSKKLYRSRENAMLGGVCAGIANYFDTDPSLVRLATVILFFAGGIGILAYIIAWIIIPKSPLVAATTEAGAQPTSAENEEHSEIAEMTGRPKFLFGMILIILGCLFLMGNIFSWFSFFKLWPIILIVIGIVVISKGVDKGSDHEN